jgi:hypothetical protein
MEDIHKIGGIPAVVKYLLNHTDLIDGTQMTVTGRTLAENLEHVEELSFGPEQDVVRPLTNPIKLTGHLTILRGNLAPGSAVAKLTGKEGTRFEVCTYDPSLAHSITPCPGCREMLRQPRWILPCPGGGRDQSWHGAHFPLSRPQGRTRDAGGAQLLLKMLLIPLQLTGTLWDRCLGQRVHSWVQGSVTRPR